MTIEKHKWYRTRNDLTAVVTHRSDCPSGWPVWCGRLYDGQTERDCRWLDSGLQEAGEEKEHDLMWETVDLTQLGARRACQIWTYPDDRYGWYWRLSDRSWAAWQMVPVRSGDAVVQGWYVGPIEQPGLRP